MPEDRQRSNNGWPGSDVRPGSNGRSPSRTTSRHAITITRRESLTATGVLDVISFDEETIIAETELGMLIIKGVNLHVNRINLENGELAIDGDIAAITYEESGTYTKGGKSIIGKLFK